MPDESMLSRGAVWARIRVMIVPKDLWREVKEVEIWVEVCSIPELDAVGSWSIELHTEGKAPAPLGAHEALESVSVLPKESYYNDVAFHSAAALTHIKSRCVTMKGNRFSKAVRLSEAVAFVAGDKARVEVHVYRDAGIGRVVKPSIRIFEEEQSLGRRAPAWRPHLAQAPAVPPAPTVGATVGLTILGGGMAWLGIRTALQKDGALSAVGWGVGAVGGLLGFWGLARLASLATARR